MASNSFSVDYDAKTAMQSNQLLRIGDQCYRRMDVPRSQTIQDYTSKMNLNDDISLAEGNRKSPRQPPGFGANNRNSNKRDKGSLVRVVSQEICFQLSSFSTKRISNGQVGGRVFHRRRRRTE